jgi:hypothetical protein
MSVMPIDLLHVDCRTPNPSLQSLDANKSCPPTRDRTSIDRHHNSRSPHTHNGETSPMACHPLYLAGGDQRLAALAVKHCDLRVTSSCLGQSDLSHSYPRRRNVGKCDGYRNRKKRKPGVNHLTYFLQHASFSTSPSSWLFPETHLSSRNSGRSTRHID